MFRNEKGQALPLALALLGLGALMIGPFLGYISTSLISSRTYEFVTTERYSSDAGVEQAVWRLTNDGLAEQLPDVGDSTSYQLDPINGSVPNITVTTQSIGGDGEGGEIPEAVIDTLEFDTSNGREPSIIKITDDIYAIGFDLSPATLEAIRGGWTDLVLDQQPYLQGYLPILQICLTKKYGFAGLHIDTGSGFAHADNVEVLAPLVEHQIR